MCRNPLAKGPRETVRTKLHESLQDQCHSRYLTREIPRMTQGFHPETIHAGLGPNFYDPVRPADFPATTLRFRNDRWAARVGLGDLSDADWIAHFARFAPLPGSLPEPLESADPNVGVREPDEDRRAGGRRLVAPEERLAGLDEREGLGGVDAERLEHLGGEDLSLIHI